MEFFSILPACAGVIPHTEPHTRPTQNSSRMRGGDPEKDKEAFGYQEFFPHARG